MSGEKINTELAYQPFFHDTLFFRLKLMFFGKRMEEAAGSYIMVWYKYKGVLYLTEYKSRWL